MPRSMLALLVSLALVLPQGWSGVAMYLCGGEQAIHVGTVGDCCEKHAGTDEAGAEEPPCHGHAAADAGDDDCCTIVAEGDDRTSVAAAPELPPLVLGGPPPEPGWPVLRARTATRVGSWLLGPPPIGPPTWLRLRTLRL